jgi:energy-coupling factor transporter ATP-binding protein EcfA2
MSIPKIKIRPFNPNALEARRLSGSPPTIVVIGRRGCGKSTLIVDLLYYMRNIPMFICMSGTEEGNGFYGKYMHPLLVHNDYRKDITSNLIAQQKNKLRKCQKAGIDPNTRPDLSTGLLLDDCGYDKQIMSQKDIRLLFMNGRHYKVCFIVSLQYAMGMPPDLRANIDFVFCLRDPIIANQKRLYDNFFGAFKKFSHFQETFNTFTNDYECLVLNNTSKSNNIEDSVFSYKANPNRNYKIGSRELWNYLDSRYNEDFDDEAEEDKIKTATVKRAPMLELNNAKKY